MIRVKRCHYRDPRPDCHRRPRPDFELEDSGGAAFHLYDRLGEGGTILVFYRGHWCPYCRRYLTKLQGNWHRIVERDVVLAAISPEPPATSRVLAEQLGLRFRLLSDPAGQVIDRYGTRNGFLTGRSLLPHPSVFVLDREGTIRFKSIDRNYKKRTTMRTIFAALDELHGDTASAGIPLIPADSR